MIEPVTDDIEVFKKRRGKTGVDMCYFRTPVNVRRDDRGTDGWLVIEFEEGGRLEVPLDGSMVWVEPERH